MNFEVGELRARVAARARAGGDARGCGAREHCARRSRPAAEAGQVGRPRGVEEGRGWAGPRKPELRPDPATAAGLGIVPPMLFFNLPPPCSCQLSGTG